MEINLEACPLCGNLHSSLFLETRDYLATHKAFRLVRCNACSFVFTNPRPDPDSMGQYYESNDYISHVQDNSSLTNIVYYKARSLMLRKKLSWLRSLQPKNSRLLDYGCGTGSFLDFLINKNWDAWGVEPNQSARKHAPEILNNRIFSSFTEIPEMEFDIITLWHVLEHLHDIHGTIDDLLKTLAQSGWLVMAVPNMASYDAQYYKSYWAGYDVPRHLSHFTPETMNFLAKYHRLQLVKTIPLKLDAFYVSMLSEKYREGSRINGLYHAIKSNLLAATNSSNYSSLVYVLKR
jgi:2-polyprenyl-3-methyl-5-hydroxy-6-metoxy-1,4-benzoquinol methylase